MKAVKTFLLAGLVLSISHASATAFDTGQTVQINNVSQDVNESSPFEVSTNSTGTFLDIPVDRDAGNYNLSINYNNKNNTVFEDVEINEFARFSFDDEKQSANASVLSGGNLNMSISSEGNSAETVLLDSEGNVSELDFQVQSPVTTIPGETVSVVNGFSVPRGQDFGLYNGTITATGENFDGKDTLNISINVFDDIKPDIQSSTFPDIMALQEETFTVEASDNLDVENVSADITYETTKRIDNQTVLVNRSLERIDFQENNQGTWTYTFTETSEDRTFYYSLEVSDESGNTAQRKGSFNVNRLSSIQLLTTDFEFKDTRPRTDDSPNRQVSKKVFSKDFGKNLEIGLEDFTHRKDNSSMSIGIRNEDDENPRFLYRNGESEGDIVVDGTGDYFLVVYSDSQGDTYEGRVTLSPVEQHEELENNGSIRFSGTVVDPEYPELPEGRSIGDFDGDLEFILNENDVPTGIRFIGENTDISDCKSVDSWTKCLPGFTLGELPEANERMDELEKEAGFWRFWSKFFILIGAGFPLASIYTVYARGTFMVTPKVYKKNVGQVKKNLDELSLGKTSR